MVVVAMTMDGVREKGVFAFAVPVASLFTICGSTEVQLDCCSTIDGFSICCRGKLESRQ